MSKKNGGRLAYGFSSEIGGEGEIKCIFCDAKFPRPPIVITSSELKINGSVDPHPGLYACPSCILSDTKTLMATARAKAKRHQEKTDRLRKEHGSGAEHLDDYELEKDWCDDSDFLNEFCDNLARLGDVYMIANHDLAVLIAKHCLEDEADFLLDDMMENMPEILAIRRKEAALDRDRERAQAKIDREFERIRAAKKAELVKKAMRRAS